MQSCSKSSLLLNVADVNFWLSHPVEKTAGNIDIVLRYGRILPELKKLICSEPEDVIRTAMIYVIEQVISETLIEFSLASAESPAGIIKSASDASTEQSLRSLTASTQLIQLRSTAIQWTKNSRVHSSADELRRRFIGLCSKITFHQCATSFSAAQSEEPLSEFTGREAQSFVSNRSNFGEGGVGGAVRGMPDLTFSSCHQTHEHINASTAQTVCRATWPLDWEAKITDVDLTPAVVAITTVRTGGGRHNTSTYSGGITIIRPAQLTDKSSEPYRTIWKSVHAPLSYTISGGGKKRVFHTMWRTIRHLQETNSSNSSDLHGDPQGLQRSSLDHTLEQIMLSIRRDGDVRRLPNGHTVKCSYLPGNGCVFGEICLRALSVYEESSSLEDCTGPTRAAGAYGGSSVLRSIKEYQEYLNTHRRLPFDMYGGAILPALHNPNLRGGDRKVGQASQEIASYNEIRRFESYQLYLNVSTLLRWKDFLAGGSISADPETREPVRRPRENIRGGREQWINIETAYETTTDDVPWNGNWLHSVDYRLADQAPRFLVEVWVNEELGGELLLPRLHEIAAHQRCLWPLVEDASYGGGITRKDYRKQTAPTAVKGWIHLNVGWEITSPRGGVLKLELRELRNISTKSIKENDVMPGAPQVIIWQWNPEQKEWYNCGQFPKFEHALYFLGDNKAEDIMGELWEWDKPVLGTQPTWFNYFSWSKPGKMRSIVQELPVRLVQKHTIKRSLHFHRLHSRYTDTRGQLWNLCRVGLPDIMRPYLWTELLGSYSTRKFLDNWFRKNVDQSCESAYDYTMQTMLCAESPLFTCIEEDMDIFAATFGLETSHRETITRIVQSLMLFCSTGGEPRSSNITRIEDVGLGSPIHYSRHLLAVCYYLSLDFASQRMSEEDIFYALLNLFSVNPTDACTAPEHILKAPFIDYYQRAGSKFFSGKTAHVVYNEAIMLRLAFQRYCPQAFDRLQTTGFNVEATFAPILASLFAGCLPPQTLYRLWDLLFNTAWQSHRILRQRSVAPEFTTDFVEATAALRPFTRGAAHEPEADCRSLVSSTVSDSDRSRTTQERGTRTSPDMESSSRESSGAHYSDELLQDAHNSESGAAGAIELLFNGSCSRLILFALAFKVLERAMEIAPAYPTVAEVKDAVVNVMTSMRDPCEILVLIDQCIIGIFETKKDVRLLAHIWQVEIKERARQLRHQAEVASVIEHMIFGAGDPPALYALAYDMDVLIPRKEKLYGLVAEGGELTSKTGLTTDQIYKLLYPASKYHCLFANPEIRKLPPGTQGRLVLYIPRVNILTAKSQMTFELIVSFQEQVHRYAPKYAVSSNGKHDEPWYYDLTSGNICVLYIETPPPYRIRLALKNMATGEIVAKQIKPLVIKKLTTQGSPSLKLRRSEFCGSEEIEIYLRYTLNVPTNDLFLPDIDGRAALTSSALKPGDGRWGDVLPFEPLFVQVRPELNSEKVTNMHIAETSPPGGNASFASRLRHRSRSNSHSAEQRAIRASQLLLGPSSPSSRTADSRDPESMTYLDSRDVLTEFAAIDRPRCFSGFNRLALEELMAFILPCGLEMSEAITAAFGRVRDRNNFQTAFSTAVSYREILTALIMLSSGSLLDKLELCFDLYGHHDPEKMSIQDLMGEGGLSGSNTLYYHCMTSPPDVPSGLHYKQMATCQRVHNMATRTTPFLPADCQENVLKNPRIIRNAISMHEIIGLVSEIFSKNGIHMNGVDLIRYCMQTFDGMRRLPRVLGASIRSLEPLVGLGGNDSRAGGAESSDLSQISNDSGAAEPPPVVRTLSDFAAALISGAGCRQDQHYRFPTLCKDVGDYVVAEPVDVTRCINSWLDRSCAETQWWGLNFFKYNTIESLGIEDPFPHVSKKLDIILTPTGDLHDVHLISADIDKHGNITGGQGGNYLVMANIQDDSNGAWSCLRTDLFVREGNKSLLSICYAFDLTAFVYDKYHFIMSILSSSLITDCLRRSSVYSSRFATLQPLNISCYMNVPFSANFHKNVLGLAFRNLQPNAKHRRDRHFAIRDQQLEEGQEDGISRRSGRGYRSTGGSQTRRGDQTAALSGTGNRNDKFLERDAKGRGQYLDVQEQTSSESLSDMLSPAYRARDEQLITRNTLEFVGEPLHGSVIREGITANPNKSQVIVAVQRVRGLKYRSTICDLSVECVYENEIDRTDVKHDVDTANKVEFSDKFLYYLSKDKNRMEFRVLDSSFGNESEDLLGSGDGAKGGRVIGIVQLDFTSLLQQTRFQAHLTLPILDKGVDIGELDVSVALIGLSDPSSVLNDNHVGEMVEDSAAKKRHLQVNVLRAVGLPDDVSPYCELVGADDVIRTRTALNVRDGVASWNDTFAFNIADENLLIVRLVDDQQARDVLVGEGAVDLRHISDEIVRVPIFDDGDAAAQHALPLSTPSDDSERQVKGHLELVVTLVDGPIASPDIFDWGSGNVRMVIDRAVNLPPALNSRAVKPYVVIELEKQKEQTVVGDSVNPVWQTAITYQCKSGSSNCVFTVCAVSASGEEVVVLGSALLNMADARRRCDATSKHGYKLQLDGLCRVTGGELWVNLEFIAYPSNLSKYQFVRIQVESVREMLPHLLTEGTGRLLISVGNASVATSSSSASVSFGDTSLLYGETYDLPFERNEIISFTLIDANTAEEVCGCAYDLWAALRSQRTSIRGDLWMKRKNTSCGILRLQLTFMSSLEKPWPDACIVDIAAIGSYAFGPVPLMVSVRDATAYGSFAESFDQDDDDFGRPQTLAGTALTGSESASFLERLGSEVNMGKRFHVGRTYGLRYNGQPAIWLDVEVTATEWWTCEIPIEGKHLQAAAAGFVGAPGCDLTAYHKYPLFHRGREVGEAEVKIRYINRPEFVSACTYLKLQVTDLTKVAQHFDVETCPRSAYLTVDLDHRNTVQCPPVKILGSNQVIDCNWVAPYRQQPIVRFTLRNEKGYALSSADLNVWDVMNSLSPNADSAQQPRRHSVDRKILIPLYQRNGQKGGKVYVRLDFICHPRDLRAPKQILVGFSHGVNLGGDYSYESEISVRVKSGSTNAIVPPKTANNLWGNWSDLLDLEPNNHTLAVEVYDRNTSEVLGSLFVHIWDLFRNPYVEWSGGLQIKSKQNRHLGTVYLAMRLILPQRLLVQFGSLASSGKQAQTTGYYNTDIAAAAMSGYFVHAPLKYTKISPLNTPKDIRRKYIAACREIAESNGISDEDRLKYRYVQLTSRSKTAFVDVANGTKVMLPDKSNLLNLFPACVDVAQGKPKLIDLAIVSISMSNDGGLVEDAADGGRRPPAQAGRDLYEQDPQSDLAGGDKVCTFPLGETIQEEIQTLPLSEMAWCHLNPRHDSLVEGSGHVQIVCPRIEAPRLSPIGMRANRLSELCERTFELHPDAYAPLGALGYAYLQFAELSRLRHNLKWSAKSKSGDDDAILCSSPHTFLRTGQWAPVIIHAITSANALVSRISPTETVVGYDLPDYARTMHVRNMDVLPSFDESDINDRGRKALVYRDCGSGRTLPYKSMGTTIQWVSPPIPRTNSMILGPNDERLSAQRHGMETNFSS